MLHNALVCKIIPSVDAPTPSVATGGGGGLRGLTHIQRGVSNDIRISRRSTKPFINGWKNYFCLLLLTYIIHRVCTGPKKAKGSLFRKIRHFGPNLSAPKLLYMYNACEYSTYGNIGLYSTKNSTRDFFCCTVTAVFYVFRLKTRLLAN
jgi:hypothetical protein